MLTAIRSKTSGLIAKILFGLLIVAFAIWGIGDIFRGNQAQKPVAVIGNVEYTQAQFQHDLKQQLDHISQANPGMQITAQQFAQLGGVAQILSAAIQRDTLKVFAQKQGMGVSQQAAINQIQGDPQFQSQQHQFDRDRFTEALDQLGVSEAEYVDQVRTNLVNVALYRSILGGVAVPKALSSTVYLYNQEQRTADVLVIPNTAMTGVAAPDDATLQKFAKDHADRYKAPEYRAASVLLLSPEEIAKTLPVSDEEIKQEYEVEKAKLSTPDIREVEQVVVQDQAKADQIEAAVKGGAAFADAVKQVTGGAPLSLGKITKDKLPAEIADKVFALQAGAVSPPLTSAFGIHVVHVISSQAATVTPLDQVKDQIKHAVALTKANDALDQLIKQVEDTLAGGASLEETAAKLKLTLKKLDQVDESGKDGKGKDTGLAPDVVHLIFSTDTGNLSPITPLADGSYVLAQTSGITPPADRPFDQVKDTVKADWLADAQHKAAEDKAKQIADKVKAGGDLAAEATALGQTVKKSAAFTRDKGDPTNDVDPGLAAALFKAKLNGTALGESKDGPVVAKVTAITPPDPNAHPTDVSASNDQVMAGIRDDLGAQFGQALRDEIKPQVHEDVVNSLIQE